MPKALWTSEEIATATGGYTTGEFAVHGLSIDTRSLQPGDLFVALKDVRDGHDFAEAAFAAGASGALVSRAVDGGPFTQVKDVLVGLEQLAAAARKRAENCYRVAITGSVGKTSVKEMLARIFRYQGPAHWNVKSFNNHWGVPLTLARMPRETERAVFEIGMNTPGEIAPRSHMVQPHTALITKIAPAHLEGLGSVSGVAEEKADIFAGLQPNGFAILPHADTFRDMLKTRALEAQESARILTFGTEAEADACIVDIETGASTTTVTLRLHGTEVQVQLNAVGSHWALNAAAALLVACPKPSPALASMAAALTGYAPPPGRGTMEELSLPGGGQFTLIDDAYNANPESMRSALAGFAARPCAGRRIVALGEMLEIGATSEAEHLALRAPLQATAADLVFLAGPAIHPLAEALDGQPKPVYAERAQGLESDLKKVLKNGDMVLLKGSNASGMNWLAERLRQWSEDNQQANGHDAKHSAQTVPGGLNVV